MSLLQRKRVQGNGDGGPEVRGGLEERSAEAVTEITPAGVPNPELVERAQRRRFTSEYKLAILAEADGLTHPGEVGALLRREGLYSSHLSVWRKQRDQGTREALSRPRGRRPAEPLEAENVELRRRLVHTEAELEKARRVIEVQGNVCALLGELHGPRGAKPDESID